MPPGKLSVVIPTHRRSERLSNLLSSLGSTDRNLIDQVVIVDDSPGDAAGYPSAVGLPVRVIHPRERQFISRAKNTGWKVTTSPLVAFIDDDNVVPAGLLERLASHFGERPKLGAVMPAVLYKDAPHIVWVYATPFRRDRWSFDLIGRNRPRSAAFEGRWLPTDALPNLSVVRREALEQVGGFDEGLPVNSSADFCQRLKRAGWEVVADTGALTLHDVEPPGKTAFWAEHVTQDPDRMRYEVADWFRYQQRWNGRRPLFRLQATLHALGFLLPVFLGIWLRRPSPSLRLSVEMVRGYRDGLRGWSGTVRVQ